MSVFRQVNQTWLANSISRFGARKTLTKYFPDSRGTFHNPIRLPQLCPSVCHAAVSSLPVLVFDDQVSDVMIARQNDGVFSGKRQRCVAEAATDTQYSVYKYRIQFKQSTTFMGGCLENTTWATRSSKNEHNCTALTIDGWRLQLIHGQAYCPMACAIPVAKNRFQT